MAASKIERLHLAFAPEDLVIIDNYRHAARLETRSEAVRTLIGIAVKTPSGPENHQLALRIMDQHFKGPEGPG